MAATHPKISDPEGFRRGSQGQPLSEEKRQSRGRDRQGHIHRCFPGCNLPSVLLCAGSGLCPHTHARVSLLGNHLHRLLVAAHRSHILFSISPFGADDGAPPLSRHAPVEFPAARTIRSALTWATLCPPRCR